jgi:hypothetical protein
MEQKYSGKILFVRNRNTCIVLFDLGFNITIKKTITIDCPKEFEVSNLVRLLNRLKGINKSWGRFEGTSSNTWIFKVESAIFRDFQNLPKYVNIFEILASAKNQGLSVDLLDIREVEKYGH